jgi:predicted nucleotidyltransferase
MNIHFDNTDLFDCLRANSIFEIEVGSVLYGLNDENSDKDILYIYPETIYENLLPYKNIHQLQFNGKDGNDYLFVSLKTFIGNILSGDSTINFDVIHSDKLEKSCLSFLYENREEFYTYVMAKSFIGMAKRDVKFFHKRDNQRLINKGFLHIMRGISMCDMIMSHWGGNSRNLTDIHSDLQYLKNEINDNHYPLKSNRKFIESLNDMVKEKYSELNIYYDTNKTKIPHHSTVLFMDKIIKIIEDIDMQYEKQKNNLNSISKMITEMYNNAYENGVNY